MKRVILTEKPSVARDIHRFLGGDGRPKSEARYEHGEIVITHAVGHLVELAEPEEYDKSYADRRNLGVLPIMPQTFIRKPQRRTAGLLRTVQGILSEANEIIIATDPAREGEMIAWEIIERIKTKAKIKRLWVQAQNHASLKKAFDSLKDGEDTKPLYYAARCRSEADWLVGMNLSRAITAKCAALGSYYSVGRVQTPTLAMVVGRDFEVERFISQDYYTIQAVATGSKGQAKLEHSPEPKLTQRATAEAIASEAQGYRGALEVTNESKKETPPPLFSLTLLQREANKAYGWTAKKTLNVAQSLYETNKAITYPRTESKCLPENMADTVLDRCKSFKSIFGDLAELIPSKPITRKAVFNDAGLTDHHAIVPTEDKPHGDLPEDESKLYRLICMRYLAALLPDREYTATKLVLRVNGRDFTASGTCTTSEGWREVYSKLKQKNDEEDSEEDREQTLPRFANGDLVSLGIVSVLSKKTKPPTRYTEATLLSDMEGAAKFAKTPQQKKLLKETSGIGTPATRADIIERLKAGFLIEPLRVGRKNYIVSTRKGRTLVSICGEIVPHTIDPAETALWEDGLRAVEEKKDKPEVFMRSITSQIRTDIEAIKTKGKTEMKEVEGVKCPASGKPVLAGEGFWMFAGYEGLYCNMVFAGRNMNITDYVNILLDYDGKKEGVPLEGFKRADGTTYNARIRYNPAHEYNGKVSKGFEFVFEDRPKQARQELKVKCPASGKPVEEDDKAFYFAGFPKLKAWKVVAKRDMTAQEYADALKDTTKEGVTLHGFVSASSGKPFSAALKYNPKKKGKNREGKEIVTEGFDYVFA